MPKGPNGQKRPADVIGLAVHVGRIATGECNDDFDNSDEPRGVAGGNARAAQLSKGRRSEIAKRASIERWKKEAVNE